jgi:hypothetical protein
MHKKNKDHIKMKKKKNEDQRGIKKKIGRCAAWAAVFLKQECSGARRNFEAGSPARAVGQPKHE